MNQRKEGDKPWTESSQRQSTVPSNAASTFDPKDAAQSDAAGDRLKATVSPVEVEERITAYLWGGGLFNPEMALHDRVCDLLIDCRTAITNLLARRVPEQQPNQKEGA